MPRILEFPYKIKSFPNDLLKVYGSSQAACDGGSIDVLLVNSVIEKLFPPVSRDQAVAGQTLYRKVFIKNESGLTGNTVTFKMNPQANISFGFGNATGTDGTVSVYQGTWAVADTISVVSSSASDTQDMVVLGENAGAPVKDTITLTGTSPTGGAKDFTRVFNITLASAAAGTITISRTAPISTLDVGEEFGFAYFTSEEVSWGDLVNTATIPVWLRRVIIAGADPASEKEYLIVKAT